MERCIDKIVKNYEDCKFVDVNQAISGLIIDSLYEIKKLEGEPFVSSAIEFIQAINNCDLEGFYNPSSRLSKMRAFCDDCRDSE